MSFISEGCRVECAPDAAAAGLRAAELGASMMRAAVAQRGWASVILATGASQASMLHALAAAPGLAWEKVTFFHLDEYLGLPVTHPASFRRYLWERFQSRLPVPVRAFHYLDGEAPDPAAECARMGRLLSEETVDVAMIGIGENAHLAFNDPPADFTTEEPYLIVELDDACRRQQLGEGWFPSLEAVPRKALSMSIRQLLKSRALVVTVPDQRKAIAVRNSLEGPISPMVPASILRQHGCCHVILDPASASLCTSLSPQTSPATGLATEAGADGDPTKR
jgi:glucosamine-6-phosphate deaminase